MKTKTNRRVLAALLCLTLCLPAAAQWEQLLTEAEAAPWQAAVCVRDLDTDSLLVAYNAGKLMRPASTQKVLTAVAALDRLGKEHVFATRAYWSGTIEGGVLLGDVRIVGGYDPLLSHADVKAMARALRELGVDSVAGQVIGDISMTQYKMLGSGWCWDDVPSNVVPYLSPLFFNHELNIHDPDGDFLAQPEAYFMEVLVGEMRALGIRMAPGVVRISFDAAAQPGTIFHEQRRTLEQVLQQMMKRSDNLHAEAVFAHLGAAEHAQATQADCADAMTEALGRLGIGSASLNVADGSGLSLYDYATPLALVDALAYAQRHPALFDALYPALPVAGVDGTLARRMKGTPAYRNVHAKTGTLTGVHTLAGYVRAANGHLLAFAIMANGAMEGKAARAWQDRICIQLAGWQGGE